MQYNIILLYQLINTRLTWNFRTPLTIALTNSHPSLVGNKAIVTVEVDDCSFNSVVVGLNHHPSIGGNRSWAVSCNFLARCFYYYSLLILCVVQSLSYENLTQKFPDLATILYISLIFVAAIDYGIILYKKFQIYSIPKKMSSVLETSLWPAQFSTITFRV